MILEIYLPQVIPPVLTIMCCNLAATAADKGAAARPSLISPADAHLLYPDP